MHLSSFRRIRCGGGAFVLSFLHPGWTIHLRLRGVDEIIAEVTEERNGLAAAMAEDGETMPTA